MAMIFGSSNSTKATPGASRIDSNGGGGGGGGGGTELRANKNGKSRLRIDCRV